MPETGFPPDPETHLRHARELRIHRATRKDPCPPQPDGPQVRQEVGLPDRQLLQDRKPDSYQRNRKPDSNQRTAGMGTEKNYTEEDRNFLYRRLNT